MSQERAIVRAFQVFKGVKESIFYEKNLDRNPTINAAVTKQRRRNQDDDSDVYPIPSQAASKTKVQKLQQHAPSQATSPLKAGAGDSKAGGPKRLPSSNAYAATGISPQHRQITLPTHHRNSTVSAFSAVKSGSFNNR